jgi:pimeloyl-ACP methyl ester carboxylesterase
VAVHTDLSSRQITVTVPHTVQNPTGSLRATLATGLYDRATGGWLRPHAGDPAASSPGGAGIEDPSPSGIFNLGFRMNETAQHQNTPPDELQAVALKKHAPTTFARVIDVDALRAGVSRSTVPRSGLQIRIYPSRVHLGDGQQVAFPEELGQLQPYALHIPPSGAVSHPHPLLLSIHSNGQHYWQYDGTGVMTELGDAHDSVVLSPLGRGHDGWYVDSSEVDVFEAWADAALHVRLDPDRTAISGYSMGGYATYRLGGLFPDLFAKGFTVVGPPGKKMWVPPMPPTDGIQTLSNLWLDNTRNVPFLNFAQVTDELVPVVGPVTQNLGNPALGIRGFDQLGYRFRFLLFSGGEHYTLAILGYHFPIAQAFLADTHITRDPAHVTFAYVPGSDNLSYGLIHDHAYWVSGVKLASTSTGPGSKGLLDVRSHGFGVRDPVSTPEHTAGVQGLPTSRAAVPGVRRLQNRSPTRPTSA